MKKLTYKVSTAKLRRRQKHAEQKYTVIMLVGTRIVGFLTHMLNYYYTSKCTPLLLILLKSSQLSLCARKPTIWVPTRSDTNRPVQSLKMAKGWKFWI